MRQNRLVSPLFTQPSVPHQRAGRGRRYLAMIFVRSGAKTGTAKNAGRVTTHGRVNKIVLALTHEAGDQIKTMIANVRAGVEQIRGAAPQLKGVQRWFGLARYITEIILAFVPNTTPRPVAAATG